MLLLDEPLSNLDLRRSRELVETIHGLVQVRGVTTLLVAHDINPMIKCLDKVIYIANGKVATGTPGRGPHLGEPDARSTASRGGAARLPGQHRDRRRRGRPRGGGSVSGAAAGPPFSWNLFTDLRVMWQFEFMRNAFEAGTIIAIVAGLVGYFVVLRRSAFASHALGHTGFSGAAAAVLVGVNPVYGLLIFTIATASGMALLGKRASCRDVEIGTVLAFALALGLLFLSLYQGYATEAYSILFGEVLGISTSGVTFTFWTSLVVLAVVAIIYRPLLFASLDEDVAEAKGMPMTFLNLAFMLLLAVTISIAVQIIGVLLIFALTVTPAAIAIRLTKRALSAVLVSILIAVTAVWAGLFIGWYEPYPVSFFIVGIIFVEYVCIRGMAALRETHRPTGRRRTGAGRGAVASARVPHRGGFSSPVRWRRARLDREPARLPGRGVESCRALCHAFLAILLLVPAATLGRRRFGSTSRVFERWRPRRGSSPPPPS